MTSISQRLREIADDLRDGVHGELNEAAKLRTLADELDQKAGEAKETADALGRKSNLSIFTEITSLRDLAASIGEIE